MQLFAITRSGLTAIAICVMALWTCIALEHAALHEAAIDAQICARRMQDLRGRSLPVSQPVPFHSPRIGVS